jgi:hypothetical protein
LAIGGRVFYGIFQDAVSAVSEWKDLPTRVARKQLPAADLTCPGLIYKIESAYISRTELNSNRMVA